MTDQSDYPRDAFGGDTIATVTLTPQEQAAYASGWNRAIEAAAEACRDNGMSSMAGERAIRALSMPDPVHAQAWRVKPLEWQRRDDHRWAADAIHRMIYITEYSGMPEPFQLDMRGYDSPMFATLEAAKAAAQADYEARIMAALLPPSPDTPEREGADATS